MADFFPYWDALKSVKYVSVAPVNHVRACCSRGAHFGAVLPLQFILDKSKTYCN